MSGALTHRNRELDIVKGSLVFVMVAYHCASVSTFPELAVVKHHLRFIHSAFLMITGFLCGIHYYPQTLLGSASKDVRGRLVVRGLKLMVVFALGNVVFHALGLAKPPRPWREILCNGQLVLDHFILSADGRYLAYEILWYIGLFLVLAGVVIALRGLPLILAALLVVPHVVEGQTAMFLTYGLVGMLAGLLSHRGAFDRVHVVLRRHGYLFLILGVAVVVWGSPAKYPGGRLVTVLGRSFESIAWFYALLFVCSRLPPTDRAPGVVASVGRYTLIAYLAQMPCARIVHYALAGMGLQGWRYYVPAVFVVGAGTWAFVWATARIRRRYTWADGAYRFWFC